MKFPTKRCEVCFDPLPPNLQPADSVSKGDLFLIHTNLQQNKKVKPSQKFGQKALKSDSEFFEKPKYVVCKYTCCPFFNGLPNILHQAEYECIFPCILLFPLSCAKQK